MNPIASCAERALREHAHPALRLSELVGLIAHQIDRTLDAPRLRATLEAHPERFRILDPWRGPWRVLHEAADASAGGPDAWVVATGLPGDPPPSSERGAVLTLRESVRWLGQGIDPHSIQEVSRWYAIALAERAVRSSVARRAA